jgi:hypothetical protein
MLKTPSFGLGVGPGGGAGYSFAPIRSFVATATAAADSAIANDSTILVDATAAATTETLPPATSCKGRKYVIKKIDASANHVTVQDQNGATIDGAATVVLAAQYALTRVQSDGTVWWTI